MNLTNVSTEGRPDGREQLATGLWVVEFCDFDVEFTVEPVGEESPFDDLPMINQPW